MKITKINMVWSDDEDDDSSSPPLITRATRKSKLQDAKLITRKILEEDLSDDVNSNMKDSVPIITKSEHDLNEDGDSTQRKSIKDIMIKVAPLVPDISQTLMDLIDESNVPATMENIDELIEKVKSLKINSSTTLRRKNFSDKTKLTAVDYNKNVNRALELLKNIEINEKADETPFTPTKVDKQIQDLKTPHHEKKFFKTGILKQTIENAKLNINEMHNTRTTRSSVRKAKKKEL